MTLASILISFSRTQRGQGCDQVDRLSFRTFAANAVRLQLYALAHNLGNFMRTAGDAEKRRSRGRWPANCQVFVGPRQVSGSD